MKYIKSIIIFTIIFLLLNIFITILSYFDIINSNILKIINLTLSLLISSTYLGYITKNKILIETLKLTSIFIIISIIFILIIPSINLNIKLILYYLIIFIINIIGNIIGKHLYTLSHN